MRMIQSLLALLMFFGLTPVAFAHGGGPHVMGTVKRVDSKSITVTDLHGKETTIAVDDKTAISQSGKPATIQDLKSGERVVVHTHKTDAGLVAVMVKFGKVDSAHEGHHYGEHAERHDEHPAN